VNKVIFACVHNAGRSQMAAAFFNRIADGSVARAISAGTQPATHIHPEVRAAMQEVGIDLAGATPQRLTPDLAADAALLITMGCEESCPVVPGLERQDWQILDPKGQPGSIVGSIRNEIRARVQALVTSRGWARSIAP
jgi:arsenate reductase